VIAGVLYAALLAALFVRFAPASPVRPEPPRPAPDEPTWLVSLHHALFYLLLLGTPVERLLLGGTDPGRALGLTLLAAGVLGHRAAGVTLGTAVSPFIAPRRGAALVTSGPYRWVRHPMYVAQALIAVGAPLALGVRWVRLLTVPALIVLAARVALEERALARAFPEYPQYAARTKRVVPFVY
jgi:protein-S-isoprenylcysteine O-methyltransferase Ste14